MNKQLVNVEKLQQTLDLIDRRQLLNGTILVAQNNQIIAERAFGLADLEENEALNIDSTFNLASVSKPIVATAILMLVERGLITLEDDINRWLKTPYRGINIKHLLTHTSGLPDYMELFEKHWDQTKIAENQDLLKLLWQYQPVPLFEPNARLEYCNTGYVFLALIIEAVTKQDFTEFCNQEIFKPLNMTSTFAKGVRLLPQLPKNFAKGYVVDPYQAELAIPDDLAETSLVRYLDGILGDGGIISNVHDLYRFERALIAGKLISPQLLLQAYQVTKPLELSDFHYGFGWIIEENARGNIVWHSGGWPGYSTLLKRYMDHDIVLIILRNIETDFNHERAIEVAIEQSLFGEDSTLPLSTPVLLQAITIDQSDLVLLCGIYLVEVDPSEATKVELKVYLKNALLHIEMPGIMPLVLHALSASRFIIRGLLIEVNFYEENGHQKLKVIDGEDIQVAVKF